MKTPKATLPPQAAPSPQATLPPQAAPSRKAILYTRVSGEDQVENTSLASQLAACTAKAAQIGARVVGHFEDPGVSGALYVARPGIQAALGALEAGVADTLIIAYFARFSRDREHQSAIKKRVEAAGARLLFCDMDFEDTPEGDLAFGVFGAFAEYERKVIRHRTIKGRRNRAESGVQPCRSMRPYGYLIVKAQDVLMGAHPAGSQGTYIIIPEEARWAREMFARYAGGQSLRAICKWLNDVGVATPRGGAYWRVSTLKRILNNPVYKGQAVFGRNRILSDEARVQQGFKNPFRVVHTSEDTWVYMDAPALVEESVWDACQARLATNQTTLGGNPRRKHMLSGLLQCPQCHRNMIGSLKMQNRSPASIRKGARKPYRVHLYACRDSRPSRNPGGHVCTPKRYNGDHLEAIVLRAVSEVVHRPELTEAALLAYNKTRHEDVSDLDMAGLQQELSALALREKATVQAQVRALELGVSTTTYEQMLQEIGRAKSELNRKLERIKAAQSGALASPKSAAQKLSAMLGSVDDALSAPELEPAEKQALLARIIESIVPRDGKEVEISLRPFEENAQTVASISKLCPPLAATSSARLTLSWPFTSAQSTSGCEPCSSSSN